MIARTPGRRFGVKLDAQEDASATLLVVDVDAGGHDVFCGPIALLGREALVELRAAIDAALAAEAAA